LANLILFPFLVASTTKSETNMIDFDSFFFVLSATFSNISAKSWRPVLVVKEAGVPGEHRRPWASN
jgi:hypothetical protein